MSVVVVLKVLWICMWLLAYVALALLAVGASIALLYFALVTPPILALHFAAWFFRSVGKGVTWLFSDAADRAKRDNTTASASNEESQSARDSFERETAQVAPTFDPYSILGVYPGVSPDEVRQAYHQKIIQNHPDKVATLDPALQHLANRRTQLINEAYRAIFRS